MRHDLRRPASIGTAHADLGPGLRDGRPRPDRRSVREGVFFAHAGKPWQRPTNENSNGLLRQYFPKGSDLRAYTLEDLRAVEARINSRPRKTLDWATPEQILTSAVASL